MARVALVAHRSGSLTIILIFFIPIFHIYVYYIDCSAADEIMWRGCSTNCVCCDLFYATQVQQKWLTCELDWAVTWFRKWEESGSLVVLLVVSCKDLLNVLMSRIVLYS